MLILVGTAIVKKKFSEDLFITLRKNEIWGGGGKLFSFDIDCLKIKEQKLCFKIWFNISLKEL